MPRQGVLVGHAAGTKRPIAIPPGAMFEHLALVGGTGVGKSVTLAALLRSAWRADWTQDGIDPGRPQMWLFDPHLTTAAAYAASSEPDEEIIYWDASDPGARWDVFGSEDPEERLRLVDPLVASQWEQWDPGRTNLMGMGPRAEAMLRACGTAVASHPRGTLADTYSLVQDKATWREFEPWVKDPTTHSWFDMWWSDAAQRSAERADLLSYFGSKTAVLNEAGMRKLWGPPGTGLNIRTAMRSGASTLVVVRRSEFGSIRTATLIRLMKHCLGPELTARDPRDPSVRPVIIATDEAAAYETQLDRLWLAELRKHKGSVVLAFQDLLGQASPELVDAVTQNAAHLVCWRSRSNPAAMARLLGDPEIAPVLETLGRGKAIARVTVGGEPQPPLLLDTPKPVPFAKARWEAVVEASRVRLGTVTECEGGVHAPRTVGERPEEDDFEPADPPRPEALPNPLTAAAAFGALKREGIPATIDADGDIQIDGVGLGRFWLIARDGDVRFLAMERCRPDATHEARLVLANRINEDLKAVRVSVESGGGADVLLLDWFLLSSASYQPSDLAKATMFFANLLNDAHKLDTQGVFVGTPRATA